MLITKANRPQLQHFVQKKYLENFCDSNGTLQAHLIRSLDGSTLTSKWVEGNPNSLGKQKNIYTLSDGSPYRIEDQFCKVEPPGMTAIGHILAHRPDTVTPAD